MAAQSKNNFVQYSQSQQQTGSMTTQLNSGRGPSSLPSLEPLSTIQEESSSESEEVEDVANDQDTVQPSAPGIISSRKRGRTGIGDAIASAILEMAAAS